MKISVVFCTYDRYSILSEAVAKFDDITQNTNVDCEILVVDNTPKDRREDVALPENARIIYCDELGLSNARNAGIDATDGEVIAFLDDDSFIREGWHEALLKGIEDFPEAKIYGGKTIPYFPELELPSWWSPWLATHLSCIDWGDDTHVLRKGEWLVGANIAFRRSVFLEHGKFDSALGRKGSSILLSNEEIELTQRVGAEATLYIPEMVVDHAIPPSRIKQSWFRKRVAWQAMSDMISGSSHLDTKAAWSLINKYMLTVPAEQRSTRSLYYAVDTVDDFDRQLKALYAHGVLYSSGFKDAEAELDMKGPE